MIDNSLKEDLFSNMVLESNKILTGKKMSLLTAGLFMDITPEIEFKKSDVFEIVDSINYKTQKIHLKIKYVKKSDVEALKKNNTLAFVYLARLMEIVLKVNKEESINYIELKLSLNKKWLSLNNHSKEIIVSAANKLFSNNFLEEATNIIPSSQDLFLYDRNYVGKMNYEIVADLLDEDNDLDNNQVQNHEVGLNSTSDDTADGGSDDDTSSSLSTDELDNMIESLSRTISDKIKGDGTSNLNRKLNESVPVQMDWSKMLKKDLKYRVQDETKHSSADWSGLNNYYRHKGIKLPRRVNYKRNMNLVIAIDHSGSMEDKDLQKMLYIAETLSVSLKNIYVIIHDTKIKKVFEIKNINKKSRRNIFEECFKIRYSNGGTSHDEVFLRINTLSQFNRKDDFTILVFSDMYSDIRESYEKYKKELDKHKFFMLCTEKQKSGIGGYKNVKDIFLKNA